MFPRQPIGLYISFELAKNEEFQTAIDLLQQRLDVIHFFAYVMKTKVDYLIFLSENETVIVYITNSQTHSIWELNDTISHLVGTLHKIPKWIRWLFKADNIS